MSDYSVGIQACKSYLLWGLKHVINTYFGLFASPGIFEVSGKSSYGWFLAPETWVIGPTGRSKSIRMVGGGLAMAQGTRTKKPHVSHIWVLRARKDWRVQHRHPNSEDKAKDPKTHGVRAQLIENPISLSFRTIPRPGTNLFCNNSPKND